MKRFLIFLIEVLLVVSARSQNTLKYQLNFKTIDGMDMTEINYEGKQILISTFDASNVNKTELKTLDSIQRKFTDQLVVVGIPFNDFGNSMNEKSLVSLIKDSLDISFPITPISQGKTGNNQNLIWKQVMDPTASHFMIKMDTPNQSVIVNTQGVIYVYFQENVGLNLKTAEMFLNKN
jgi:glutathione peroxidase-family protein